jgi:hypothetical protein
MPHAALLHQLVPAGKSRIVIAIEEAKSFGLVRSAPDEMGLKPSIVAPAGMKG